LSGLTILVFASLMAWFFSAVVILATPFDALTLTSCCLQSAPPCTAVVAAERAWCLMICALDTGLVYSVLAPSNFPRSPHDVGSLRCYR
jgi:hypothetical protein